MQKLVYIRPPIEILPKGKDTFSPQLYNESLIILEGRVN